MPFLAAERILVDPANHQLILPKSELSQNDCSEQFIFEISAVTPVKTSKVPALPTSPPSPKPAWKPSIDDTTAAKIRDQIIKEYPDVFSDELPNKPPPPNAPKHRIQLKEPMKSINGRMFSVPAKYLNSMLDFIDMQLEVK